MLVWANLHAGCIFGFVLIGFFFIGEIVRLVMKESSGKKVLVLAGVGFAVFGTAFINPYGSIIPLHVFNHLNLTNINSGQQAIMEWLPPASDQIVLFYVVFVLWGAVLLAKWRNNDSAEVLFFCAFLYMGTSQVRHSVFVPILAGFYLPVSLQYVVRKFWSEQIKSNPFRTSCRYGTLSALGLFLLLNVGRASWGWGLSQASFPVAATQFLHQNRLPPNETAHN